jgi:hypothetical protein
MDYRRRLQTLSGGAAHETPKTGVRHRPGLAKPSTGRRVLLELASDHVNQVIFVAVAAVVALGYSILLPFAFTQRLSLHNWHYLDGRYLAFSLAFGLSIGWLLTVQLYAMRRVMRLRGAGVGGTAAADGVPVDCPAPLLGPIALASLDVMVGNPHDGLRALDGIEHSIGGRDTYHRSQLGRTLR